MALQKVVNDFFYVELTIQPNSTQCIIIGSMALKVELITGADMIYKFLMMVKN